MIWVTFSCHCHQNYDVPFGHYAKCYYVYLHCFPYFRTKDTLNSGNLLSVINVLMQLRKVCNHPNLFEERPVFSSFIMERLNYYVPSLILKAREYDPFKHVNLGSLNLLFCDMELTLTAYQSHRMSRYRFPARLITEIDNSLAPPPTPPVRKIKLLVQPGNPQTTQLTQVLSRVTDNNSLQKILPLHMTNGINGNSSTGKLI